MKLLASDFDGTLFFHSEKDDMRIKDLEAIRKFQDEGNLFGICTGRHLNGIIDPTRDRVNYDFYIVNSGAVILDKNKNVIQKNMIKTEVAKKVVSEIDNSVEVTFIIDNQFYAINRKNDWPIRIIEVSSMDEINEAEIEGLAFHFKDIDETTKVYNEIVEKYNDIIDVYQNVNNLDFAPKGCSKGNALKMIMDYYKIDKENMNCIGDSWNDLPMFKSIENSFTFTYSPVDVQKETKHVINNLEECISIILDIQPC